ncbi:MAG: hypothetical protein ACOYNL_03140 [Rickettsiales bacterium]
MTYNSVADNIHGVNELHAFGDESGMGMGWFSPAPYVRALQTVFSALPNTKNITISPQWNTSGVDDHSKFSITFAPTDYHPASIHKGRMTLLEYACRELDPTRYADNKKKMRIHEGYDLDTLKLKMNELVQSRHLEFMQAENDSLEAVSSILNESGILHRIEKGNNQSTLVIGGDTEALNKSTSALMDRFKKDILNIPRPRNFVITKPDGTVLDPEQAAQAISERQVILDAEAAKLKAVANKFGVAKIVEALSKQAGREHPRNASGDASGWLVG